MHETMTMEKFENSKKVEKLENSKKMAEQAILGQSQEEGTATSVFKTKIDRESYLYTLSLSKSAMDALKIPEEQIDAAKANIRSEVKDALAVLRETSVGGTALNYKKREAALKVIDDLGRAERMKQQTEMLETLKKGSRSEKVAPATTSLSPDQVKTQARIAELEKAAASATVQNNTPEDMARIATKDAATKEQRLDAATKRTAELQATLVGTKKTGAPAETVPKILSPDQVNTQARMAELREANKSRENALDFISTMNLEELKGFNDSEYKNDITDLTTKRESTTSGSKERARIESILSSYGSAMNVRNESQKYAKTDAQKLENERAFARALVNLEAQK